jgi:hypothetical protein
MQTTTADFHLDFFVRFPGLAPEGGNANGETLARRAEAKALVAAGRCVEVELSIRYDPYGTFSPLRAFGAQHAALAAEFGCSPKFAGEDWKRGEGKVYRWTLRPQ